MTAETVPAPRFSIIVPAYQAAPSLGETLDAVLVQTFDDWECIVVDDGSTDDTLPIAAAYSQRDARIRVIHQDNGGTAAAYNTGVSSAIGEFIVICSADDILLPEHLSRMSAFIESEEGYDIYSSDGYRWSPGVSRELVYGPDQGDEIHSWQFVDVVRRCFFGVGATYRRRLFAAIGGYRLGVYGEDYDFWLRAMASGARHRYLPEPLALHRISVTQKSADLEKSFRSDISLLSDLDRNFPLSQATRQVLAQVILDREDLIARLDRPLRSVPAFFRTPVKRIVFAVIGPERAWRLVRAVRSARHRSP